MSGRVEQGGGGLVRHHTMTSATSGQRSLMARRTLSATCNAELRVSCGSPKTTCDRDKQKSGGKYSGIPCAPV